MRYAIGRRLFRWGLQLMGFPPEAVVAFVDPWFAAAAKPSYETLIDRMSLHLQTPGRGAVIVPDSRYPLSRRP